MCICSICFKSYSIWRSSRKEEWPNATNEEYIAIERDTTWELKDLPDGKNSMGLKWVIKTKYHADGSIQKHKAGLVVKGYSQEQGIDFKETFSATAFCIPNL